MMQLHIFLQLGVHVNDVASPIKVFDVLGSLSLRLNLLRQFSSGWCPGNLVEGTCHS